MARDAVAAGCLVAGGVCYSSWVLEDVVSTGLSHRASYASELEATGQSWAWLFRSADVVSGLLLLTGALLALRLVAGWLMRLGIVAVAVVGLTTAGSGPLAVDCTSSTGGCVRLRARGVPTSWHDSAHHAISNVSGYAFGVALGAFALAVLTGRRAGRGRTAGPVLRRTAWPLVVLAIATSIPVSQLVWSASWRGVPQRANEVIESALFVVLGLDIWSSDIWSSDIWNSDIRSSDIRRRGIRPSARRSPSRRRGRAAPGR